MIWYIVLLVAIIIIALAKEFSHRSGRLTNFSLYHKRDRVMSESEQALYINLQKVLGEKYIVLSKVRIEDFVETTYNTGRYGARGRIKSRHVDFLICDRSTTKPLLAIELDGKSHQREDRQDRDRFVDKLYEAIDLQVLHIPVGDDFLGQANHINDILNDTRLTEEERSAHMREVRMTPLARAVKMTPEQSARFAKGLQGMVDNLNKNVREDK